MVDPVRMLEPRSRALSTVILFLAATLACDGPGPTVPDSDEPLLIVVLTDSAMTQSRPDRSDAGLYALVAIAGTPLHFSPVVAERFEMRRASDGALFAWRPVVPTRPMGGPPRLWDLGQEGNYYLPFPSSVAGLGASDISAGDSYLLSAQIGERVIQGRATLPSTLTLSLVTSGAERRLVWPRVDGAAGYAIRAPGAPGLQRDTFFVLPRELEQFSQELEVVALDTNLFSYTNDQRAARAGIDNGYGVFGATTSARISLGPGFKTTQ